MGILAKPIPFGDYFLLEKINTGGMAEVYKAKTFGVEGFERIVAVKKILPAIAEDREFISMFIDEAKIAVQLTHANIVQIFDLGNIDGQYYIAMEYIPGRDLRVIYDRCVRTGQKLDIACVCYIISKMCEGLDYAHNKTNANGEPLGIVHRDISPQNVLISYDGDCKLIDFGIAKAANKSSATQVGILKGKFSYMSPEQVAGKMKIDRRSDIFALGIVLFEMLTLKRLFLGSSDFETLEKIRKVEVSPPTLYNPDIPEDLEDIVLKALEKDVTLRYQTAAELQEALQRFMFRHNMYYTPKDLSNFVRPLFAQEIALEQQKTEFYKELTRDVLEASRAPAEDETAFYEKNHVPRFSGVQFEHVPPSVTANNAMGQKQQIYADLDNFQPPKEDIVYSPKTSSPGMAPVSETGDVVSDMASSQLKLNDKDMPAPRRSMSSLSSVSINQSRERETVMQPAAAVTQKTRITLVLVVVGLIMLVASLCGVYYVRRYDAHDGQMRLVIEPENVPIILEINGEQIQKFDENNQVVPLLSGTIELDRLSRKNDLHCHVEAQEGNYDPIDETVRAEDIQGGNSGQQLHLYLKSSSANLRFYVHQKDATVKIDGTVVSAGEDGQSFEVQGLAPGEYYIEIAKDRYKTVARRINIKQGDNERLSFMLAPLYSGLRLISEPPGTEFTLRNLNTGDTFHVKSGETVQNLPIEAHYEISFRDGNETVKRSWTPRTDGEVETKTYMVRPPTPVAHVEEPAVAVAPTPVQAQPSASRPKASDGGSSAKVAKKTESAPPAPAPKVEAKPAAATSDAPGIFKISSKPPCEIFINGKSYGTTPKKIELPAGSYKIRFVNAEAGIDSEQTEVLASGGDVKVNRK